MKETKKKEEGEEEEKEETKTGEETEEKEEGEETGGEEQEEQLSDEEVKDLEAKEKAKTLDDNEKALLEKHRGKGKEGAEEEEVEVDDKQIADLSAKAKAGKLDAREKAIWEKIPESMKHPTGTIPPGGEGETTEQRLTRLEKENEDLKRDSQGKLGEIVNQRERIRLAEQEAQKAGTFKFNGKSVLEGLEEDDYISVAAARQHGQEVLSIAIAQQDELRISMGEQICRLAHEIKGDPPYEEVITKFVEMAEKNPVLKKLAYYEANPAEYMYQKGLTHPDFAGKAKTEARRKGAEEVIDKITKRIKIKIPKGGGGGDEDGGYTLEKLARMSPTELKKVPDAVVKKFMKE